MENLDEWIREQFNAGYSQDKIFQSLLKAGYSEQEARSSIQRILGQRKSKSTFRQYRPLIYLLSILIIVLFLTGGYLYALSKEPFIQISPQDSRLPKINVTREVQKNVSPGSRLGVLLKASSDQPLEVELYEKLPDGFTIMNSISSMPSERLNNNIYLFNITKKPDTYGVGITYFVKVPQNAESGSYQIQGWYKADNQKINIEPTKFDVV